MKKEHQLVTMQLGGGERPRAPPLSPLRRSSKAARSLSLLSLPPPLLSRSPSLSDVILSRMAGKLDFLSRGRADVISRQSRRSRINSGGASILVTAGLLKGNGDGMRLDEKKRKEKKNNTVGYRILMI